MFFWGIFHNLDEKLDLRMACLCVLVWPCYSLHSTAPGVWVGSHEEAKGVKGERI